MFGPDSRYASTPTGRYTEPDGRSYVYVLRRRIPRSVGTRPISMTVGPEERADVVSNRAIGDPIVYWHLCDTNQAIDPAEITEPGRTLLVTPLTDPRT